MTSLQIFRYGSLLSYNAKTRYVVEASYKPRTCVLDWLNASRCLPLRYCQSNSIAGVSGVVARIGNLEKENVFELSGVNLAVSLVAAVLITSVPPALSADFENLNSAISKCSLTGVQANGYEYAYPETWIRDRIRGIEVSAHDPEVSGLNFSIFTSPTQSGTLSGSAAEVKPRELKPHGGLLGEAIIAQYQKSPIIDKAELLGVNMKQDGSNIKSYSIELLVDAGGKQRHLLTKLIRTDRKVLSLTLQVPEELWLSNASCMKSIVQNFKQTAIT